MKNKSLRSLVWVIKIQLKTSKLFFVWSLMHSIYSGVISVAEVYVVAKLITSVTEVAANNDPSSSVYKWLVLLLGIELFSSIVNNLNRVINARFEQNIDLVAHKLFYSKLYSLSQEQFDDQEFVTKVDRAQDGMIRIWRLNADLTFALSSLVNFIGAIGAILFVAPAIGLLIVTIIIPLAFIRIQQNKASEALYKQTEPIERIAYRSRWLLIDPNTMPEIRMMSAFSKLAKSWNDNKLKSNQMHFDLDKKNLKRDLVADAVPSLLEFGANVHFFRLLLNGTIELDRFIFLRGILQQASSSAVSMANSLDRLHNLSVDLRSFQEVYNALPAIPDGNIIVARPLTIEFKNVSFSYPGSDQKVLDDISFIIAPGSRLALVGENGAGKSTLIKLLLRQYLPTSGSITVNGHDISKLKIDEYYAAISNLSQDFMIINHLTIEDNLLMGLKRDIGKNEVMEAVQLVGADKFINNLKHGINTRLDTSFDDGTDLSGGQMQRIGVARALLRDGDLMILDEPTSAIDAKGEYMIFNNIYRAHEGRTTLIVSHRFSTVRKADKIIVMENGKITEYGSHEELIAYGRLYKEMFEAQAEGYK